MSSEVNINQNTPLSSSSSTNKCNMIQPKLKPDQLEKILQLPHKLAQLPENSNEILKIWMIENKQLWCDTQYQHKHRRILGLYVYPILGILSVYDLGYKIQKQNHYKLCIQNEQYLWAALLDQRFFIWLKNLPQACLEAISTCQQVIQPLKLYKCSRTKWKNITRN